MDFTRPQKYQAVIEQKKQLTSRVYLVTFRLLTPQTIEFVAGQTFMMYVSDTVNRTMSIASPPSDKTHVWMCHDVTPGGPGSQWTLTHNVGDKITLLAPTGRFVLDKESNRKKVMIATGTGVAPFRSMIMDYLEGGGTDDITLYWGLRREEDMYWFDEFNLLSIKYPNFRFVFTLSQPKDDWKGKRGRVTDHVIQEEKNLPGTDFFLCGNQAMVLEIKAQLLASGVPSSQIHNEMFY
jgi:NAD(P)H-flavin reductase